MNTSLPIVVCVVLALMGCAASDRAKYRLVDADHLAIAEVLTRYHADVGKYPSTDEGLAVLVSGNESHPGSPSYLAFPPVDPWGHLYGYRLQNSEYHLLCAGADGVLGTPDDVLATFRVKE